MNETIAIISAATALLAVFFGPLITLRIHRRQLKANLAIVNRQQWINELRDRIAEFLSLVQVAEMRFLLRNLTVKDMMETHQGVLRVEAKIKLMLNSNEDDHRQLLALLADARELMAGREVGGESEEDNARRKEQREKASEIVALSQKLLKREWERVKRFE